MQINNENETEQMAESRSVARIDTNIEAILFCGNIICTGIVKNLSKKGMFIRTEYGFSDNYMLDIVLRARGETIKVPVKVKRTVLKDQFEIDNEDNCLGVELLDVSPQYKEFLSSLQNTNC